jgi:2-polyprenyl-3-methyl-5-hydroxy-6-metoxy-1,4-benzoquinol methylase
MSKFSLSSIIQRKFRRLFNDEISRHHLIQDLYNKNVLYYRLLPDVIKPEGLVKKHVQEFLKKEELPSNLNTTISKNDLMFLITLHKYEIETAFIKYLQIGFEARNQLKNVIEQTLGGFDKINSFLDFASGHGRLTRFLVHDIDPKKMHICEIKEDALNFQSEQFGVNTIQSTISPNDFETTQQYDLIFVGSLFTHLDKSSFEGWLVKLSQILSNNGVLIFTTHNQRSKSEFEYIQYSEDIMFTEIDGTLSNADQYGTSFVSESFVRNVLGEYFDQNNVIRKSLGWNNSQDIFIASKKIIHNPIDN